MEIIDNISFIIGLFGISVIVWGSILAMIRLLALELQRLKKKSICRQRNILRHHLGSYLLLGLEFLIAADIIRTIRKPSFEEIGILAGIVAIRTVINYFLNKEISETHNCLTPEI